MRHETLRVKLQYIRLVPVLLYQYVRRLLSYPRRHCFIQGAHRLRATGGFLNYSSTTWCARNPGFSGEPYAVRALSVTLMGADSPWITSQVPGIRLHTKTKQHAFDDVKIGDASRHLPYDTWQRRNFSATGSRRQPHEMCVCDQ